MKKYISFFLGILLMLCNGIFGELISADYGRYVSLIFLIAGAGLVTYAGWCVLENHEQNKQRDMERFSEMSEEEITILRDVHGTLQGEMKQIQHACEGIIDAQGDSSERVIEELKNIVSVCNKSSENELEAFSQFGEKLESISKILNNQIITEENLAVSQRNQMKEIGEHCESLLIMQKKAASDRATLLKNFDTFSQGIEQVTDDMEENLRKFLENENENINHLVEDVQDANRKQLSKTTRIVEEIREIFAEYDSVTREHLDSLAAEYQQFQKLTEEIIEQLTQMSDKDYEVLKGILNG